MLYLATDHSQCIPNAALSLFVAIGIEENWIYACDKKCNWRAFEIVGVIQL